MIVGRSEHRPNGHFYRPNGYFSVDQVILLDRYAGTPPYGFGRMFSKGGDRLRSYGPLAALITFIGGGCSL
jgi:hypothetical protein